MRASRWFLILLVLTLAATAAAQNQPLDLMQGLRTGQLWAQFRGAGDRSVSGVVGNNQPFGQRVSIPSGQQFYAQRPGLQGMMGLGSLQFDLGPQEARPVMLAAVCTALNLPSPTPEDIMIPVPCPDARLASVASVLDRRPVPQPVVQLAAWAISNNPPLFAIEGYLAETVPGTDYFAALQRREIVVQAADLLAEAGVAPAAFQMFRGLIPPARPQAR